MEDTVIFQQYGFLPELIGRFSRIVPFAPLPRDTLLQILRQEMSCGLTVRSSPWLASSWMSRSPSWKRSLTRPSQADGRPWTSQCADAALGGRRLRGVLHATGPPHRRRTAGRNCGDAGREGKRRVNHLTMTTTRKGFAMAGTNDRETTLQDVKNTIARFTADRDWQQFHMRRTWPWPW